MSMMSDAELTQLRADILDTLPDTCTIKRKTTVTASAGTWSETYEDHVMGVQCRVDPFRDSGGDGVLAMREASISWYRLTVPYNTDLAYGDRVVFDSDTYEIVQLADDHSLRAVRRAVIAKIQGES